MTIREMLNKWHGIFGKDIEDFYLYSIDNLTSNINGLSKNDATEIVKNYLKELGDR